MALICKFHKRLLDLSYSSNSKLKVLAHLLSSSVKPLRPLGIYHQNKVPNCKNYLGANIIKYEMTYGKQRFLSTSDVRNLFERKEENRPPETRVTIRYELFEDNQKKEKKQFLEAVNVFKAGNTIRKGHIEFIYTCMRYMEEFGVDFDLESYKSIMDIFPKGKMIAENSLQVEFYHFPMHQTCAIDLLDKMELNGICPDKEMREIIVNTFGNRSHVYRKFARMMYWMPKFKNMSPYPIPNPVPNDALELARIAMSRMCVDLQSFIKEYHATELEDSLDKTWIVSGMSPKQKQFIEQHDTKKAIYVEGPYLIWLRRKSLSYYMLRAEPKVYTFIEEDLDDVRNLDSSILNPLKTKATIVKPSIHEQDDGIILALCATGTSSRDSLLSWIRFLQNENPKLLDIPILFTLKAPSKELVSINFKNEQELLDDQINEANDDKKLSENSDSKVEMEKAIQSEAK